MISPQELRKIKDNNIDIENLCKDICEELKKTELQYEDRVEIILRGSYSKEIRNSIAEKYKGVGWSDVTHNTSSENGERPGLTVFAFYY